MSVFITVLFFTLSTLFEGPLVMGNTPQDDEGLVEVEVPYKSSSLATKLKIVKNKDDAIVGERYYYANDKIFEEVFFVPIPPARRSGNFAPRNVQRVRDGKSRKWHLNGVLWEETNYKAGKLHGICTSWNDEGEKLHSCEMKDGSGVLRTYDENGKLELEVAYHAGVKHGSERRWHKGSLSSDSTYLLGKLHGWSRQYHSNGARRDELNYSYGKAHGFLHIWDVDGELTDSHGNGKVTPYYYLHGEETTREQYLKAVKSDPILRQLIGRPETEKPAIRIPSKTTPEI